MCQACMSEQDYDQQQMKNAEKLAREAADMLASLQERKFVLPLEELQRVYDKLDYAGLVVGGVLMRNERVGGFDIIE